MRNLKYFLKIYTYRRSYIIVDPCQRSARAWSGKCVAKNDGKTTKKWALKKSYLTPSILFFSSVRNGDVRTMVYKVQLIY